MLTSYSNILVKLSGDLERIAARQGMLRYIEKFVRDNDFPAKDWPIYVKNELFKHINFTVGNPQSLPVYKEKPNTLSNFKPLLEEFAWKYSKEPETLIINTDLSNFHPHTQTELINRMTRIISLIRDDKKRHEYQKNVFQRMTDKELINEEPVIVKLYGFNELRLFEGWHRTSQLILEAQRRKMAKVRYRAYVGRKGNFFNKIDYYLSKLHSYLANTMEYKNQEDALVRVKTPYRDIMKELSEQRSKIRSEIKL